MSLVVNSNLSLVKKRYFLVNFFIKKIVNFNRYFKLAFDLSRYVSLVSMETRQTDVSDVVGKKKLLIHEKEFLFNKTK